MIDFLMISTRPTKRGIVEIYPKFIIRNPSEYLMIRGGDFYAIWVEEKGLWSTSEQDAIDIIDRELDRYAKENGQRFENGYKVLHLWDAESGMIDAWHKYCQRQMRDSFHMLDEKLIFSNTQTTRKDYASKRLPYPLENGDINAWDRLLGVLYSEEERRKIEWAIGSIVSGDSRKLQKFMVFYGAAGTGKSTVLNIIQQLFEGYTSVFDAKALGQASNSFALESFKTNPLVAIQHDGDLSRIEDNTRLNSLVSHELMTVNEKFKGLYSNSFKCFLFMGTNRPVKITDAKSGLIRRLIDVSPTGEKLKPHEYKQLMKQITFELGAIANHCMEEYLDHPDEYDDYIPLSMLGASNDFYNFVMDSWPVFRKDDETTLKAAWVMYKAYCEDAKVAYPYSQRAFKEELKNYFREYKEREMLPDGTRVRSYYKGFRTEKFEEEKSEKKKKKPTPAIDLKEQPSIFDVEYADCPAQYANDAGTPSKRWENVTTKLRDLDTSKPHYVKTPEQLIVIDFDILGKDGEKSFEKNLEEAGKWPPTYAEVSKSGKAIHLHYIYDGDVSMLSRIYADHIEIKVFNGNSSLRRKLSLCNDLPIAHISSGLPLKEAKKIVNFDSVQSEKGLRTLIKRNLNKEIHAGTKPSIDFIYKILDDAYNDDKLSYDVSDMRNVVLAFAAHSTHQADYCIKLVGRMQFKSRDKYTANEGADILVNDGLNAPIVFYDVEVFPNLFLINWKLQGEGKPVVRMINPKPSDVEELMRYRLIGFNCRRYDNHILYGRLMGYSNMQLYNLSQRIISGGKRNDAFFGEAYNVSYTDVYDFASAGNKKSLKKFEIELGIHHQELGLPWDKPVPEELWPKVAEYCDNDVIATEAVFNHLSADWTARQILADIAGMTVNDTTNSLTTRIIFDRVRKPQAEFNYRDLSQPVHELKQEVLKFLKDACPEMMSQLHGEEESLLPYFPGYYYGPGESTKAYNGVQFADESGRVVPGQGRKGYVSIYRDEEVGEGGYVYAEPGMYGNVALLDIASMHPHSVIAECLFGPTFTKRFKEIVDGRVSIKHEAWDDVNVILDGKLAPYVQKVINGEMTSKQLADALKTAINSVYGLTSAAFENAFRDPRNKDNIVAKRGALFMVNLKNEVQQRGFTVAHIKTDSIKIPDASPEIIQFVMNYGKQYGYTFEHEATYDKMCLVNDAVYIAKYKGGKKDGQWTATGKQFAVPYVFKTLFSREPIQFKDMCETFSVSGALYLDMNEKLPDVSQEEELLKKSLKALGMSWEDWQDFLANPGENLLAIQDERSLRQLQEAIESGHDYHFVGRVGEFTPIKAGCGGGVLLRESGGKYSAATGSKGFRWMESEMVTSLSREQDIDRSYYDKLVDDAIETISQYGDFEWFQSDDRYDVPPEGDAHDGA
ncbi:MAG: hypothetical protein IJ523_07230 [Succinivibrionaceae bacterium]|nr:hypothetical protein [Succinivibrionaceae bacterium]